MRPVFSFQDLRFFYPGQSRPALDGVCLDVSAGAFLVLCGPSGCGKSTLLRHCKTVLAPHGTVGGTVLFDGKPLPSWDRAAQTEQIGFVLQNPDNQLVTDKVWHELAFALESLGLHTPTIRHRVAEMASYFGIQDWFYRDVATLSGGQKQLVALAAVMALQPKVLILDEPTAQLDPLAAADFLGTLARLNRDLGVTVILSEHRLEEALPLASQVAVMDQGRLLAVGSPREVALALRERAHPMFAAMPVPMRVWAAVGGEDPACPITVREGRDWLEDYAGTHPLLPVPEERVPPCLADAAALAQGLCFRYEKDGPDVIKDLSFTVKKGELFCLLGGNGTGKTTALKLLAGLLRPQRGQTRLSGPVGMLPQDPQTLFVKKTVGQDLAGPGREPDRIDEVVRLCRLEGLLERHPYDLSGGEQQRLALAKVLLAQPEILLLDEPTKGLDAGYKATLAHILQTLTAQGVAIVMVSHDIEFCARYAHRCALFFDGAIVTENTPRAFFAGNSFYTTAANRMARERLPQAVTAEDVIAACGGRPPAAPEQGTGRGEEAPCPDPPPAAPPVRKSAKGPLPRRTVLSVLILLLLVPLTLALGQLWRDRVNYYAVALLILLECMIPFFLIFEGRRPKARELVLIAVLCALGVAGRAAFLALPQCKPVAALVVVSGAALGGEVGFLVGAVSMLLSNMLFAQGPWTPWQMFAMGLIGFLSGLLLRRCRSRWTLALFGGLCVLVLYGGLVNAQSALAMAHTLTPELFWSVEAVALPMDLVHAATTVALLLLGGPAMLDKLERVKTKYGLVGR